MSGRKKNKLIKYLVSECIKNPNLILENRFAKYYLFAKKQIRNRPDGVKAIRYLIANNLVNNHIIRNIIKSELVYKMDTRSLTKILNTFNKDDYEFFINNTFFTNRADILSIDFGFIDLYKIKEELLLWFFEMFPQQISQANEECIFFSGIAGNQKNGFLTNEFLEKLITHKDYKVRFAAKSIINKCLE